MRRVFLSLGSTRIRLMLGLILAALLMAQIFSSIEVKAKATAQVGAAIDPGGQLQTELARNAMKLAKEDPVKFFNFALENYHKSYRNYTCRLTKQERLGGRLGEVQVVDIKFKEAPFSVLMVWQENPARGDKMLYVEDPRIAADKWMMFIHPSGAIGRLIRVVERRPDDPEVLKSSLRSINEAGFLRGMESLRKVYSQAQRNGHLIESSYLGTGVVDGRPTFALKRVLPNDHDYPAKTTIVEIDQEYLVPVHVKGTNWQDQPLCEYTYSNIKFNTDLKDSDFTRKANGLD
ncbi:MAG: DUF1571 domain-containing protein [Phycisphaerae bacterium]|nr:DUF1571 domain-containing protein [Phycisphaerae bacterium]